ncbi:MAG: DNA-processing protein DprA [bacterium]
MSESFLDNISISPTLEMGAYEALWLENRSKSFKAVADIFRKYPGILPSELVMDKEMIDKALSAVYEKIEQSNIKDFGTRIYGTMDYPKCLRVAANPIEFFYYRGWWDIAELPKRIAVIGTRNPSEVGVKRAKKLVKLLVRDGYTIVSGLARGIDTVAHKTAIESGGNTIAVIGTPITEYYPPENKKLQDLIAEKYLLISQIPICKYSTQTFRGNRLFFPERNITMSALTHATVIVEAGETSGTLIQAKAALQQGRKLFIMNSCFLNPKLTWPKKFEEKGAIRISDFNDITL